MFLLKIFCLSCKGKSKSTGEDEQQTPITKYIHEGTSLGMSYQVSKWCCSVVLASHSVDLLLLLLHQYGSLCSVMFSIPDEITQVVSWIVMIAIIINFQKETLVSLPWIIRLWWISGFFQSAICAGFRIQFTFQHKKIIGVEECIDVLSLLACACLSAISIRGVTGISFNKSSTTEPLLHSPTEKQLGRERNSLYSKASLSQLVTFSWLTPLFILGKQKPLEQAEVPDIDIKDSAEFSSHTFDNDLTSVKEKHGLQNSSIYRTIFIFIRKKVAINACLAIVSACASYVGPSLIDNFVNFLGGTRDYGLKTGYLLAVAFLSAKCIETVAQRQWIFGARQLGLRLRAALISHIYRKGIRLSNQSRQNHTSGEIINYMSVDIQRITDVMWYANIVWMLPVQISLAIYVLHKNLGLGAFAGLAATFIIMSCNIPLTRTQKRFQAKIMEAKDSRMKATSEVLKSMKILKLQAWDTQYLRKLEALRDTEYGWLWKSLRLQALSAFIFWGAPAFISSITFGACILMGIPLTAGRVLSALATFRMLQDPIFSLPDLLNALAQAKVSADRIAAYLQEEEIKSDVIEIIPREETEFDIEIDNGVFSWDADIKSPTLTDVQLTVKRGMKVAICGTVGSGKSSLLSSILGEIPKLGGRIKISGAKAYVPQTPWILTGNVRENILFGNPYDRERYEKTIQGCALIKDLKLFATGDMTEIGERGINMSGGQKQRIQIARAVYQDADIYLLDDPFSAVDAHTGSQLFKVCLRNILIILWLYKVIFAFFRSKFVTIKDTLKNIYQQWVLT